MTFQGTEQERELLLEVLESAIKTLLHELHHSDSSEYRHYLRRRLERLEALQSTVLGTVAA